MPTTVPIKRDPRIDLLRGVALLMIFIDHVPGNLLGTFTLRNFGFSDAAEVFVLLAGVSSTLAYGRLFERAGPVPGLRKIAGRCGRIYAFQIGLLFTTYIIILFWADRFGLQPRTLAPLLEQGMHGLKQGVILHALPSNLNILPLYIVLLASFPLLYLGMRRRPLPVLLGSGALWAAANLDHGINLTNGSDGQGWFFNPFSWQFLFALGIAGARLYAECGQTLPRRPALRLVCAAYVLLGLLAAAPWTNWGLSWRILDLDPDKTTLAPLRLINVLAFIYLLMTTQGFTTLTRQPWLKFVEICGRHSLEVFSLGTLCSLFGHLVFCTFGMGWELQVLVNGTSFVAMVALATLLERQKRGVTASRPVEKWRPSWR